MNTLARAIHLLNRIKDVLKENTPALPHFSPKVRSAKLGLSEAKWDSVRLRRLLHDSFDEPRVCVIANREPYIHRKTDSKTEVLFPASGLVSALEPIVKACSGMWIAHGSGNADKENSDAFGRLAVPPGNPEYWLKRIWLSSAEEKGYYYGFSNEGLWPLCHIAHTRPTFESEDWKYYLSVNEKFARAFHEENLNGVPIVLIQDYHFAPLPRMIRLRRPEAIVNLFWHIPWPNPEAFGICPWKTELLAGMLGADLIGFHTQFHCNNFLDTAERFLEARVDREDFSVTYLGHTCYVKPFPISIEWPSSQELPMDQFDLERKRLLEELGLSESVRMGVGVDRLDYTKGIVERFRSVERLLERHPEWIGKFCFVQIAAPSRTAIKRYQNLTNEVKEIAEEINKKFSKYSEGSNQTPTILFRLAHHSQQEIRRYFRAADLCFVTPLHDGMNLVAKEFVAARSDLRGVLILSHFAGAARELKEALLVNPYAFDECAEALHRGLRMGKKEQMHRMENLRNTVSDRNVYAWAAALIDEISQVARRQGLKTEVFSGAERPHSWYGG
jgi:trehalose-6-phosphate synthase